MFERGAHCATVSLHRFPHENHRHRQPERGSGKDHHGYQPGRRPGPAEKKILVIDLDPQANATSGLGIDTRETASLYPALLHQIPAEQCIQPSGRKRLDIIPSTMDLAGVEIELARAGDHLTRLRETLAPLRKSGSYDYCIMDTPPPWAC